MVKPLLSDRDLQSGIIAFGGRVELKSARGFRQRAREISDNYFPTQANEPTNYAGTIYRYSAGKSRRVRGRLTRKEKLFGEWGEPTHVALVQYFNQDGAQFVTYHDITKADLAFLM